MKICILGKWTLSHLYPKLGQVGQDKDVYLKLSFIKCLFEVFGLLMKANMFRML